MERRNTLLKPTAPYDFALTAGYHISLQSRKADDPLHSEIYRRPIEVNGRPLLVSVRSTGTVERPELEVEVAGEAVTENDAQTASKEVAWILATDMDVENFYSFTQDDPTISSITRQLYGLHPTRSDSIFEALVTSIIGQQLAATVARIIRSLLMETYGSQLSLDGRTYPVFPSPEAILSAGVDGLRGIKLSARKAEYILNIASEVSSGSLSLESIRALSDEEAEKQVTGLRGVGKWTWQWLQISTLGHPDAFPAGDLALRRTVSQLYFGGESISEEAVLEFSLRWSPWRSLVTFYLFAALRRGLLEDPHP